MNGQAEYFIFLAYWFELNQGVTTLLNCYSLSKIVLTKIGKATKSKVKIYFDK